jgi:hypothetical protein
LDVSRRVLIYRADEQPIDAPGGWRALRNVALTAPSGADAALSLLIAAGEFEAAVCDVLEDDDPLETALRHVTTAAARVYLDLRGGTATDARPLAAAVANADDLAFPRSIRLRTSEGFAYYALYPETYAAAAERLVAECAPPRIVVLGIRSIGTTLSAVVAAQLSTRRPVASFTVRPTGHPFDRVVRLTRGQDTVSRAQLAAGATFAIVDEGPGLSGSSFASVVRALQSLDVPEHRIVLFPSWDPDPAVLRSADARKMWARHRKYFTDAAAIGETPERIFGIDDSEDWSGGRWRARLLGSQRDWPAVQAQHERWKIRARDPGCVVRFAGLGRYGEHARERAAQLADAGLCAHPVDARHGFLALPYVEGTIAAPPFTLDEAEYIGRYIAIVAREFRSCGQTDSGGLLRMIETNVREIMNVEVPPAILSAGARVFSESPAAAIDGRTLAHEWIRTRAGLRKVDALDHGADHFFPGPQHPSWDLAAASLECNLRAAEGRVLVDAYTRASGDAQVRDRLPWYRLAYAAFRAGYATMAEEAVADPAERARFTRVRHRMTSHLHEALDAVRVIPSAP